MRQKRIGSKEGEARMVGIEKHQRRINRKRKIQGKQRGRTEKKEHETEPKNKIQKKKHEEEKWG